MSRQTQDINNTNDPQKKYRLGTVSKNILLEGLNRSHCANLTLSSDVDQDTYMFCVHARLIVITFGMLIFTFLLILDFSLKFAFFFEFR